MVDDLSAEVAPRDPLEDAGRGRAVVLVTCLSVALALTVSIASEAPSALPGIALGASALLHFERALVVGALIAGASIFLIRGWVGYFPSKISTAGAEYAVDEMNNGNELATAAVEALRIEQLAINRTVLDRLGDLGRRIEAITDDKTN
jgi:hypothetical protein